MEEINDERTQVFGRTAAIGVVAVAAGLFGISSPASASIVTYFGIDQGNGTPPTTPANSLARPELFLTAEFSATGVENFDPLTVGAFPSLLSFPLDFNHGQPSAPRLSVNNTQ